MSPLVIDTDVGGDADDAVALVVAARTEPDLALVLTTDETTAARGGYGQRARAARRLLDACGREDVPVVPGAAAPGGTTSFCLQADDLAPAVAAPGADVLDAVEAALGGGSGRWVGIGPMGNLARVLHERPDLASRLVVTQMGGAIHYRRPDTAEHNIRLDVAAAHAVVSGASRFADLALVISDVTFTERIAIAAGDPRHAALGEHAAPWARLLATHLDRWFASPIGHSSTMQHDALTLSVALGAGLVHLAPCVVALDQIGRMRHDDAGAGIRMAVDADHGRFMSWLDGRLDLAHPA